MESHKRILGILYIVSGVLQIITLVVLASILSTFLPMIMENDDSAPRWVLGWIVPFFGTIVSCIILFFSIPAVIGGIGLLNEKKWALMLILILGCFKLFSFPIGTLLGIYTIWVYAEDRRQKAVPQ